MWVNGAKWEWNAVRVWFERDVDKFAGRLVARAPPPPYDVRHEVFLEIGHSRFGSH